MTLTLTCAGAPSRWGGAHLFDSLLAAGVVDVLHLTLAPTLEPGTPAASPGARDGAGSVSTKASCRARPVPRTAGKPDIVVCCRRPHLTVRIELIIRLYRRASLIGSVLSGLICWPPTSFAPHEKPHGFELAQMEPPDVGRVEAAAEVGKVDEI